VCMADVARQNAVSAMSHAIVDDLRRYVERPVAAGLSWCIDTRTDRWTCIGPRLDANRAAFQIESSQQSARTIHPRERRP